MSFKNTIWAGGANSPYGHADTLSAPLEIGASVKPGNVVRFSASAEELALPAGGNDDEGILVVLEGGEHLGEGVDTTYDNQAVVEAAFPRSGELFNLIVNAGSTTQKGGLYTADASGRLFLTAVGQPAQFMALETTGASASDRLVTFKKL